MQQQQRHEETNILVDERVNQLQLMPLQDQ